MDPIPAPAPPDPCPMRDRVVLVTGGAQGIGRGIAQAVLGAGGIVEICDADAAAGEACLEEWRVGDRAGFERVDVASDDAVGRWVRDVVARRGRIDGLVNNAGIADPHSGPLDRLEPARWHQWLGTHLDGAYHACRHALPALRAAPGGGSVVNIASSRAHQSEPHTEAYAAAKGALVAFTHALAISEGPAVRVNCVSPGWVPTEAWQKPSERHAPRLSDEDRAQHPAGRVGTPEDIGALALYLLSPASGFMTGQELVIDGGMNRKMQYA